MTTEAPASILHLGDGEGALRAGGRADLIAIRKTNEEPAARMQALSTADIELVMMGGRVQLASKEILGRLPSPERKDLQPLSVGGNTRWLRAPVRDLLGAAERILGRGRVRLSGKPVRGAAPAKVSDVG